MRALDLFCCAGGVSDGLKRAGFTYVAGVDIEPQPEYPYFFMQANALSILVEEIQTYDFVWASPPCQKFTAYRRRPDHVKEALNLIPETRELLQRAGVPYVIENVPGAPLENHITLCGSMFGLNVRRHRCFEASFPLTPPACNHSVWTEAKYAPATNRTNKRKTVEVGVWRIPMPVQLRAMGLDREVSREKLSQMIPPAYAEWLGRQAMAHIHARAA